MVVYAYCRSPEVLYSFTANWEKLSSVSYFSTIQLKFLMKIQMVKLFTKSEGRLLELMI